MYLRLNSLKLSSRCETLTFIISKQLLLDSLKHGLVLEPQLSPLLLHLMRHVLQLIQVTMQKTSASLIDSPDVTETSLVTLLSALELSTLESETVLTLVFQSLNGLLQSAFLLSAREQIVH